MSPARPARHAGSDGLLPPCLQVSLVPAFLPHLAANSMVQPMNRHWRMSGIVFPCALGFACTSAGAQVPASPRAVERSVHAAFERGAEGTLRREWTTRAANPHDRGARFGLGLLDDLAYRHDSAARQYRALSTGPGATDRFATFARLAWGRMEELRGRMADAAAHYDTARVMARGGGDREAEGLVLLALAFLRANAEGVVAGEATLDTAARLLPDDPGYEADLGRRRATLLAVQLDPRAATVARDAARAARRAGDTRMEANAIRAVALDYKMRGVADSSLAALEEAARLQRRARDRRSLSETLVRIADLHIATRRLGNARRVLLDAESHASASHNEFAQASIATGLGAIALRLRDLPLAQQHLARAAALNLAARDSFSLVQVQQLQGVAAFQAGLLDTARTLREAVLRAFEETGEIPDAVTSHEGLATIALARGDPGAAHRALDAAEALVRRHQVPGLMPSLWYARARVLLHERRDPEAAALLRRFVSRLPADDHVGRWDAQVHLAYVRARAGEAHAAARDLASATAALERWRAAQDDSTLRLMAFQVAAHEGGASHGYFARTIAAIIEGGAAEEAFVLAERQRARTLAERMAETFALAPDRAPRPDAPVGSGPGAHASKAIRERLAQGVALVEYVTGRDGAPTSAFVVTRAAVHGIRLAPADSLAPLVRRLLVVIEQGGDARALRRMLGDAVVAPLLASMGPEVTRLVLVPDGALHRVPFDALVLPDDRAVLERFAVSHAPSAALAVALRRQGAPSAASRVLAVGDPHHASRLNLPPLPEARAEAQMAARYGRASVALLGAAATPSALQRMAADSFGVLHLATHAQVDERSLLGSSITLSPEDGDTGPAASGMLGPGELAALRLGADLVVLSACRSAGGVVVDGEGVQGLTAPLLAAGARAVVASTWDVEDLATRVLMEDFYRGLSSGLSAGDALRGAQLAAMRAGSPVRDWAGMIVVGNADLRIPLAAPSSRTTVLAGGLAALVLVGVTLAGWRSLTARRRLRRA